MKTYCLFLFSLMVMACGENGLCRDEELAFARQEYNSNELKVQGYYFHNYYDSVANLAMAEIFLLYKNGVLLFPGVSNQATTDNYVQGLTRSSYNPPKYNCGVFRVENSHIEMTFWTPGQCIAPREWYKGILLNDSTFIVVESNFLNKGETTITQISDTFHFRAFSPKPDSTNDFIE